MIEQLRAAYPIQLLCRVLNYSRSSYYYRRQPREEAILHAQLRATQGQWPTYGYRRLTAQLQRDGLTIGQTRVRRLRKLLHLQAKTKAKKRHTTNSQHAFPRYPNRVHLQLIDAQSPVGLWKQIRHWIFTYPAWIIDRRVAYAGWDRSALETLIETTIANIEENATGRHST